MTSGNGRSAQRKPTRTVNDLADRIDVRFDRLKTLIVWMYKQHQQPPAASPPESDVPSDGQKAVQDLGVSLHRAVDCLTSLLQAGIASKAEHDKSFLQDLARSLVLSGNGERLELTVESVIRNYCQARDDVRRYTAQTRLPAEVREDIVAGFTRVMENHRLELELLGVTLEEVTEGTEIDAALHDVVKRVPTEADQRHNTIRECMSPVFRWKTGNGSGRFKPARVVACIDEPSHGLTASRRHGPT